MSKKQRGLVNFPAETTPSGCACHPSTGGEFFLPIQHGCRLRDIRLVTSLRLAIAQHWHAERSAVSPQRSISSMRQFTGFRSMVELRRPLVNLPYDKSPLSNVASLPCRRVGRTIPPGRCSVRLPPASACQDWQHARGYRRVQT